MNMPRSDKKSGGLSERGHEPVKSGPDRPRSESLPANTMGGNLELLRPFLEHRDICKKWADGIWTPENDCTCGLEAALIEVDENLLGEIA